ncbi:MAG: flagellar hook-associated protein FlgK [Lachnospiraceae bacterium]|nr:flagellar hook-associated protein FlgK [Lachnospiraceae bacterium]
MSSLMGSLYVGTSGLQTSQNALNTTSHNMANAGTPGYVRQIVMQSARPYNTISIAGSAIARQQLGLGVLYAEAKTQRDVFLDKSFRKESGRSAFYEISTSTLEEVEDLLQELDGEAFEKTLNNLWKAVQDLANEPEKAANQSVFVQRCFEFVTRAISVYDGFAEYQNNINQNIKTDIERINEIGKRITDLNVQIQRIEAGKVERANDQRDIRDRLIDELASYADISYQYDVYGNVTIKLEGNDFVKHDSYNEISLFADPITGFYTPYWRTLATTYYDMFGDEQIDIKGAAVFNLGQTISADMNTDIGMVKSKLLARGTHRATYEDIQRSDPNRHDPSHPDFDPTLTPEDRIHYDLHISQSVIMNMQAQFDQLINKVVVGINDILRDAAIKAENDAVAAGKTKDDSAYMKDAYGEYMQIFNLISPDQPFTVSNIIINGDLRQAPTLLGFQFEDGQYDNETVTKLKELFENKEHTLNPNVQTKVNLAGYYNAMVAQVANSASVSREILNNQKITVDEVADAREQVIGVSTDEELSNMIMFQNAFNASSRYINVVSEMLEHIVTRLGNG